MLIAIANLIISSSNFLFPTERVHLNNSEFEASIVRDLDRLPNGVGALLPLLPSAVRDEFRRGGAHTFCECARQKNCFVNKNNSLFWRRLVICIQKLYDNFS